MLSRNCDGCSQMKACHQRYSKVAKGGKVYCPDGTCHLVDQDLQCQTLNINEEMAQAIQ